MRSGQADVRDREAPDDPPQVLGERGEDGATLAEVLKDLESRYPGITKNVVSEDGGLHRFINVYVNDEDVRYLGSLETAVADGDVVSILPAVAGG
jgi:sulfur-carrier protein